MCFAIKYEQDGGSPNSVDLLGSDDPVPELITFPGLTCKYCQRAFKYPSVLRTHIRIHTGEKPFVCEVCNKSFAQRSHLSSHSRVHSGDRPYQCEICRKQFSQLCNLKTHIRIHSGEKPVVCKICEKRFAQRHHLKTHMVTHTGDRPFECRLCRKQFSQKSNLVTHMKTHREPELGVVSSSAVSTTSLAAHTSQRVDLDCDLLDFDIEHQSPDSQ